MIIFCDKPEVTRKIKTCLRHHHRHQGSHAACIADCTYEPPHIRCTASVYNWGHRPSPPKQTVVTELFVVCRLSSSCVRAFVRAFVRSCVRAFVRSCVRAFVRSCVRAFVRCLRGWEVDDYSRLKLKNYSVCLLCIIVCVSQV